MSEVIVERIGDKGASTAMPIKRATTGSAGYDLEAYESAEIKPGQVMIMGTGIRVKMPKGIMASIRPRSSTLKTWGLIVIHGTIDTDYRGEIKMALVNITGRTQKIGKGERIAQIVFEQKPEITLRKGEVIEDTERGRGGFGSTGR